MILGQNKIKEFFEEEKEKIAEKIEKTPMEKFFVFFLILITISTLVLGYFQFKKNIEGPLFPSYLQEQRGEIRAKYQQAANLNTLSITGQYFASLPLNSASNFSNSTTGNEATSLSDNSNQDLNSLSANLGDLTDLESKLLSGEVTLQQLGIDDPSLQQMLDQIKSGELQGLDQLNPQDKAAALENLKSLTPSQIRQELENRGIDKATLDQLDDETLQTLFLETLKLYQ